MNYYIFQYYLLLIWTIGIWWILTIKRIYPICLDLTIHENRGSRFLRKFVDYLYNRKSSYPRIVTDVRTCIPLRNTEIFNEINYNINAFIYLFIPQLNFIKCNSYNSTLWSLSRNFWQRGWRTLERLHYGVVRDIWHRFYKAILYFRNTRDSSKHENVISLTPIRKHGLFCADFHETRTEQHYVQNA